MKATTGSLENGGDSLLWLKAVGVIALGLSSWALLSVVELKTTTAVSTDREARIDRDLTELKGDVKRIAEAVGAKKP